MLLSDLPSTGVARLRGTSADALAAAADRRAADDPIVVFPGLSTPPGSTPSAVIDDVLVRAAAIAFELFPAWLPDAESAPESGAILDRVAARALSHRHDGGPGTGTALGALATAALRPPSLAGFAGLPPADRRAALEYALTRSYGAHRLALALEVDQPLLPHQAEALSGAAQWLARGSSTVWLFGPGAVPLDRFPQLDGPPAPAESPDPVPEALAGLRPAPSFPPVSGRPHPASAAEQRLEQAMAGAPWAKSRHWNRTVDLGLLHPPVRVDLLFPQARLVVEVDGADHRAAAKYEADRRRDADLMLAGYRVLRITNTRIFGDVSDAVSIIRTLVLADDGDTGGGAE